MLTAEKTLSDKLIAQSKKNERIEIAKNMLIKGVPIDTISEYTNLSIEDISQLQQEL